MPKQLQASLTGGEISPSLYGRTDLAKFAIALATCRNFFVRPTGGASNRPGLEFVYALDPNSLATLIPFVFSTDQSYMLVFQENTAQIFTQGAFVQNGGVAITNVVDGLVGIDIRRTITTAVPHGFLVGQTVTIINVVATGTYQINGTWLILDVPSANTFRIIGSGDPMGGYTSGGSASVAVALSTPYLSADLASLRYTQSADVVTVVNQLTTPYEFVRVSATSFTFGPITDFDGGPFLDDNVTSTTVTSSGTTGVVTLTASSAIFNSGHVGSLFRMKLEDLSQIPPWEPNKFIVASGNNPDGLHRQSNGKVYIAAGNSVAPAGGTFTGTKAPDWDEGTQSDGDGNVLNGVANSRAGVKWQFQHPLFGIARITAVGGGGTTATATVLDYIPVLNPDTTTKWAFGAWSEDQGYPALVTYFSDRLVFANTPGAPQTEWASKTGDYHNFSVSSPQVANDSIRQRLNARQINAIVELIPMDQLIALTSSSSWASPKRGEDWTPTTIGYDPQSFDGAAFLRAIQTGDSALFVQAGGTKVRDLSFKNEAGKFVGDELTVMARHLFDSEHVIVDADYAKEPHGILWIVRSDGALIGLTYLPEQEVVGWHRHDTDGFFERVCVIPENGVDTPYFVVRREVNGATVRYLERMAIRDRSSILDAFFVDSGLTYDGRNKTATTITISGASYDGGATVTLTSSASLFGAGDVGDAIQFPSSDGNVRANITGFTSSLSVTAVLQAPVPAALQGVATTTWTFARDTFSGLSHLEGKTVAILADGSPEVPKVVTGGSVSIPYPAGVVHIGLPYTADIETLNVNLFNSPVSITDSSIVIPKVSVLVEKTLGLKAGPDASQLYDFGLKPTDFDYNSPWELQSDAFDTFVFTDWKKRGHILLRQDNPLPATVLTITPNVEVGLANGGQQ